VKASFILKAVFAALLIHTNLFCFFLKGKSEQEKILESIEVGMSLDSSFRLFNSFSFQHLTESEQLEVISALLSKNSDSFDDILNRAKELSKNKPQSFELVLKILEAEHFQQLEMIESLFQSSNDIPETYRDRFAALIRYRDELLWKQLQSGQDLFRKGKLDEARLILFPLYSYIEQENFPTGTSTAARNEIKLRLACLLASIYQQSKESDRALAFLNSLPLQDFIFADKPKRTLAQQLLLQKAVLFSENNNFPEAKETLRLLISLYQPKIADPYQLMGLIGLEEGNIQLSSSCFLKALKINENATNWFNFGLASYLKEDASNIQLAVQHLQMNSIEALLLSGLLDLNKGLYQSAIANLSTANTHYNNSLFIQRALAKAYIHLGIELFFNQPTKAQQLFYSAINLCPHNQEILLPQQTLSYDPESLEALLQTISPILALNSHKDIHLEKQIEALLTYLRILDGSDVPFPTELINSDPFIRHLELHLALKAGRLHDAYTSLLNLKSVAPEYEGLYHAWFHTAQMLMDSSEYNHLGLELMTELSELKAASSPYPVIAQLQILQKSSLPLLPDPALVETPEEQFRLGINELLLANAHLDAGKVRSDTHDVDSALDKTLSLVDSAKNHLYEATQGSLPLSLHLPSIYLSQLAASSIELDALQRRAFRMKNCSFEKESILSCASWFEDVALGLKDNPETTDPEVLQRAEYDCQYAKTLAVIAQQDFDKSIQELEKLKLLTPPAFTIGSLESAKLFLSRELISKDQHPLALEILLQPQQNQNPRYALEMAIERSICYRRLGKLDRAIHELSQVINSEYALSARVQAALLRAEVYKEMGRLDLTVKQLNAVKKKGGQWAALAERKLAEIQNGKNGE